MDTFIFEAITTHGKLAYLILFTIIFSETGLVVMAFLPGDSLLFAVGTLSALGSLNYFFIVPLLIAAAVLGNTTNYFIGRFFGNRILNSKNNRFINKESIDKTSQFYEVHGTKTVVIAQLIPFARSASPFLAGTGSMNYTKFITYNIIGAIAWVGIFVSAGYLFGNVPIIKNNLSLIVFVVISFVLFIAFISQVKNFIGKRRTKIINRRIERIERKTKDNSTI